MRDPMIRVRPGAGRRTRHVGLETVIRRSFGHQPKVDGGELLDNERAQVVLHAFAQLCWGIMAHGYSESSGWESVHASQR